MESADAIREALGLKRMFSDAALTLQGRLE